MSMKALTLWKASLLLLMSATVAHGQTLAEVAREEEARRKTVKEPSKVYTNADLQTTPQTSTTSTAPASSSSQPDGTTKAASPKPKVDSTAAPPAEPDPAKDEKYWRDRITAARTEIDRTQTYLEAIQTRINALTTDFVNRDDPAQRSVIEMERKKALAELDRLKGVLVEQTKAVTGIEEEARHKGVPPGWLR